MPRDLLTRKELAAALGMHRDVTWRMKLRGFRFVANRWARLEDAIRFLDQHPNIYSRKKR